MRVTYIDHSGFLIDGATHRLLFDYYRGPLPEPEPDPSRALSIFASHHHPDHYVPEIYRYGERTPGTRYYLGCDVTLNAANRQKMGVTDDVFSRCDRLHKDDVRSRDGVTVQALRSTDMGVAFYVTCEGKHIYHAGDHNLWLWREDVNFDRAQIDRFYEEIEKLRGLPIDAAFLPLDPRLGDEYWRGFDAFMRLLQPTVAFPMHMVDDYAIIDRLKAHPCSIPYRKRIAHIHACGECFEI